jgi:NAD(P)-dependent dehydrogenase (short-subunit alcohol dehydrogenase family)
MESTMNEQQNSGMPPQHQERQPGREWQMMPEPDYMPRFAGSGKLQGKIAQITGGDSGIGRASAILFAREGADIALLFLEESEDARKTQALVEEEGVACLAIAGDAGDKGHCERSVARIVERFGRIDVLVNNCGEQHDVDAPEEISPEQLERTFRSNIFSQFYMTQAVLPHMGEGSAIVNVTSVTAYRGSSHLIDYSATKGAIVAFTRSLAKSLAGRGIRANGVAPGPIWTPLIPASFPEEAIPKFGTNTLIGRPGQPNEVAPSLLFLACEDSSYMTGQVLHPNGGDIVGG